MTRAEICMSLCKILIVSFFLLYFTVDSFVLGQESTQEQFLVEVSAYPEERGVTTGSGKYNEGEKVTVTATVNEGYVFANWLEGDVAVSSEESYVFEVTENRELVGIFIPKEKGGGENER